MECKPRAPPLPQAKAVYSAGVPTWDYARYALRQDPPQEILQDPWAPCPFSSPFPLTAPQA